MDDAPHGDGHGDGSDSISQRFNEEPLAAVRIVVRPIGSPVPLGFFAFTFGTALASMLELGWLPRTELRDFAAIGLTCIMPLEVIASLFAFLARDGTGATLMGIFAASWTAKAVITLLAAPGSHSAVLGVFHLLLGLAALLLALAASQTKPFYTFILVLAAARFAFTGLHDLWPVRWLALVAGWCGAPIFVAGLYGSLALIVEDSTQRTVLPLFRRGKARAALEGDLREQLRRVANEAGVRQQL